jgi:hypothetical protein
MIKSQETLEKYGYLPGSKRTNTKPVIVECDYCNKLFEKEYKRYLYGRKDLPKDCCAGCAQQKINELNSIRGHSATRQDVKDKKKATNLARYGVENPFQDPTAKAKIKATNQEKYGVDYPMQSADVIRKANKTNQERYGVSRPLQNKDILQKSKDTNIERYGSSSYCKSTSFFEETYGYDLADKLNDINTLTNLHHTQKIAISKIAEMYGIPCMNMNRIFHKHGIEPRRFYNSSGENEVMEYVRSLGFDAHNHRIDDGKLELDIYVPGMGIAFEYNGLYFHSEVHVDRGYHLHKTTRAEKSHIRLIHIFEDEWLHKQDIVKSRIASILGVSPRKYARKCSIVTLNPTDRSAFFNTTHLQGDVSSSICYGLQLDGTTVAAMSFGRPRFNNKYEYEMLRYSSIGNVIGGASRLFAHFVKEKNPKSVISYCDRRWGSGNVYTQMGFNHIHDSEPNYFWCKGDKRYSRYMFMKSRLIKEGYDPTKTEDQIMAERGFIKIHDCGNSVFEHQCHSI